MASVVFIYFFYIHIIVSCTQSCTYCFYQQYLRCNNLFLYRQCFKQKRDLPRKSLYMLYIENILSLQVKNTDRKIGFIFGAGNRGRTDTMLPSRDFKSLASACSAIPAQIYRNSISRAKTFVNCRRGLKTKIKQKVLAVKDFAIGGATQT